jgi:hypothetical protein
LPILHLDITWLEEKLPHRVPTAPLTVVGINKIGPSGLPNWIVQFLQFESGVFGSYLIHVAAHYLFMID